MASNLNVYFACIKESLNKMHFYCFLNAQMTILGFKYPVNLLNKRSKDFEVT